MWNAVIRADAEDSLRTNWWLRVSVGIFLTLYLGTLITHRSTTTPLAIAHVRTTNTTDTDTETETGAREVLYVSPEGLQMTLSSDFPVEYLMLHYWCGVLLVVATVAHKLLVPYMLRSSPHPHAQQHSQTSAPSLASSSSDPSPYLSPSSLSSSSSFLSFSFPRSPPADVYLHTIHPALGYTVVFLLVGMAAGGWFLRPHSSFEHFRPMMLLFLAPWLILGPGVVWSARTHCSRLHSVMGNCIFKACIAVPLARVLGAALQRFYAPDPTAPSAQLRAALSYGYYHGIAASALLIGAWAIADLLDLLHRTQPPTSTSSTAKTKSL